MTVNLDDTLPTARLRRLLCSNRRHFVHGPRDFVHIHCFWLLLKGLYIHIRLLNRMTERIGTYRSLKKVY